MFDFLTFIPLIGPTLAVVLPFIIVISVVVFIHEYGHYIVGRWCGIHAETFSLGFGPVMWSRIDRRGTVWQVAAIPMGGYVKFLGDQNAASGGEDADVMTKLSEAERARTFHGAALWRRALTVFAGPAANFVLSVVVFAGMFMASGIATQAPIVGELRAFPGITNELQPGDEILELNGTPIQSFGDLADFIDRDEVPLEANYLVRREGDTLSLLGPYPWLPLVGAVNPVTPAAKAGLRAGDLIVAVGDTPVRTFTQLQAVIRASTQEEVTMTVLRDGQEVNLQITPRRMVYQKEDGSFGERVQIGVAGTMAFEPAVEPLGPVPALWYGAEALMRIVVGWAQTIYHLVTGGLSAKNLQGPVGIAVAAGDTASQGLEDFIYMIAFISTAIGLMNLLPIPILDGGHLVIFAYQAVFRREPNPKVLQVAMTAGLALLLMLMVYATTNDIMRL